MSRLEKEELTDKQTKLRADLRRFIDVNAFPPTLEGPAAELVVTKATVRKTLKQLAGRRYPKPLVNKQGCVWLVSETSQFGPTEINPDMDFRILGNVLLSGRYVSRA